MTKAKVLFAEDDPLLRDIYAKKFTAEGFEVIPACNGEEAIKLLEQNPPDVALVDISMPKVDGFQVLEHFPRDKRTFPMILLTNFDQEDYRKRGKDLGADDYFVKKDMTIRSLIDMVNKLLQPGNH